MTTKTAIATEDHDPRPIRMLVLEDAIRRALETLDEVIASDCSPVEDAEEILREALGD